MAVKKAKELSQTNDYQKKYSNISFFKFSNKWINCFMNCYNLSNHWKIIVFQYLLENLLEK